MLFETRADENSGAYSISNLMVYAQLLDLNIDAFGARMATGESAERIRQYLEDAKTFGVTRIPAIFINGVRFDGLRDYADYRDAIEAELARLR